MDKPVSALRKLPSVDEVMRSAALAEAVTRYGRSAAVTAVRAVLGEAREQGAASADVTEVARSAMARLEAEAQPNLKPVFNLTGTVLHTNLGRALIAESAIEAATVAMRNAVALEFDLGGGRRGERDELVRDLLCELTGAEDATIVNNNAAAVLLVLNTFAKGREAIVSRGELIEIGGAFRMPEIMSRAGAKLHEIGTTNRTHKKDYVAALSDKIGLILKVHTSNYRIEGFTKEVSPRELAALAHEHSVPLVNDLGSGTLVDLTRFGLKHEPTVAEAVAEGADLVTFSGDKLLGGPQTGFIVGRKALIEKLNKNPMKRALRVDKIRLAMVEATLRLYRDPDRLAEKLPTYRLLARPIKEMEEVARRIVPVLQEKLGAGFAVKTTPCTSQVGSGALPVETLPSLAVAVTVSGRGGGRVLTSLSNALRKLPVPVVGRIEKDALLFDLRCLENVDGFLANLSTLNAPEAA
ncbi:L-seryl-tRNA(Sec) selenium transferase [Pseudolabrys sp. Root1462]|uniref:L-seryl-tRNA(Sec) selenium transferase n=1 Tax=Pseudolabrys sp. Root1462 TaxID=1736466 RepID=UPI0007025417|nr:L-seryl-tRNA(Sec) selenium transferase [Pseudolabrys sp. Root1462]KQY99665.1 L-seryl-tRNA(Sec) selenium transferase [Pseudolabrys sp. Root1462]